MKKIIIIPLFVLCMAQVIAQTGWPPVGAKWHYSYQPCSIWGCSSSVKEFIYFEAIKDTMLNDTLCTKIIVEYHNDKGEVKYLGDEFIYSTENQVYNYHHGRFYLLYDFLLQVGDTVELSLGSNCHLYDQLERDLILDLSPLKFYVGVKDSIEIDGEKYLFIDMNYIPEYPNNKFFLFFRYKIIIKTIGSLEFLIGRLTNPIESGIYGPLRCYSDSNVNYTTDIPCETLTSSGGGIMQDNRVWVYPNPVTSNSIISFPNILQTDIVVEIFDELGRIVSTIETCEDHTNIESDKLSKGIFHYRVYSNEGLIGSGRLLKIE